MAREQYPSIPLSFKPEDIRKASEYNERKVNLGRFNVTLKKVTLYEVDQEKIITFGYRARRPGTTGRSWNVPTECYDATPLLLPLNITRSHILGLNTHYLTMVSEKSKFIYKWRMDMELSPSMIRQMIHQYRLDRISSPIYECKDFFVDQKIIATTARWVRI